MNESNNLDIEKKVVKRRIRKDSYFCINLERSLCAEFASLSSCFNGKKLNQFRTTCLTKLWMRIKYQIMYKEKSKAVNIADHQWTIYRNVDKLIKRYTIYSIQDNAFKQNYCFVYIKQ